MFSVSTFTLGAILDCRIHLGILSPVTIDLGALFKNKMKRVDIYHTFGEDSEFISLLPTAFVKPNGEYLLGHEDADGAWENGKEVEEFTK